MIDPGRGAGRSRVVGGHENGGGETETEGGEAEEENESVDAAEALKGNG